MYLTTLSVRLLTHRAHFRYNDRLFFAAVLEGIVSGIIVFMIPYGAVNGSEASMLVFGQGPLTLLILVGNT